MYFMYEINYNNNSPAGSIHCVSFNVCYDSYFVRWTNLLTDVHAGLKFVYAIRQHTNSSLLAR